MLLSNRSMMRVFEKLPYVLHKKLEHDSMSLLFHFDELKTSSSES